jgi:hypothetical protein
MVAHFFFVFALLVPVVKLRINLMVLTARDYNLTKELARKAG